jgi:hypothetical protein
MLVKPACKRQRTRHVYAIKSGTIVQKMPGALVKPPQKAASFLRRKVAS